MFKNQLGRCLLGFFVLFVPSFACGQIQDLHGNIRSAEGPIMGVSILVIETKGGAITGDDGSFKISGIKHGLYTLQISAVGYETAIIKIRVPNEGDFVVTLQESALTLSEVTVEGDVFRQTQRESSVVVEKVTASQITKNGGTTLMSSLERLPGISSINMGVGVSKPVIRGMSFNRVVVNDSGIKQEGQQWGSDHGLEIDQFSVDQVEIVRGPASLAYGSDALGGVLNIRHSVTAVSGVHRASTNLLYRSNNNTVGMTAAADGNQDGFVYKVRASMLDYGDYKVPATEFTYNRFVLPIYNHALKNTAGKEKHANVMFGVQKSWGYSHLMISNYNQDVGIFSGAMGIPRSYQLNDDGNSRNVDLPSQKINHFKVISNNSIKLHDNWLEIDAGYQKNMRQEYSHPHAHGSGNTQAGTLALQLDLHTVTLNARHYSGEGNHQNVIGVQSSLQRNIANGHEFLIPDYTAWQGAGFWLHKYSVTDKLVINGGLRVDVGAVRANRTMYPFYYENHLIDSIERNPDVDRQFFNYSAGIGLAYNTSSSHAFKANFGKTYRVPASAELMANGMHHGPSRYELGDPTLNAEEGFQLDAAWLYTTQNINLTVSPFYNYFRNYIYLSPSGVFATVEIDDQLYPVPESGQVYAFKQTEAIHTGGEVEITWQAMKTFSLSLNGEYVWAQNLQTRLPLPFTPPATLQFIADLHLLRVGVFSDPFLNMNFGYYFSQNRVENNEAATDAYPLLNLSSGFGVGKKQAWMEVNASVQNVLDRKYMNHLSRYRILNLPEPARNFVVNVRFKIGR